MVGLRPTTDFTERVRRVVRAIPRGSTRSYGEVAAMIGAPGGARAVVRALRSLTDVPWWRVIRSDGTVAPQMEPDQSRRLRAEGVRLRTPR